MKILLIEDDAGLVELITVNLKELGYSVINAPSGAKALTLLKTQTPDLILLDYSLPDINGKELIETLIKQQKPSPPFIITTGQGNERIAVDMMKLGAKDYVIKDLLFIDKLRNVVQRVIKEIETDDKLKKAEKTLKKQIQEYEALNKELIQTNEALFIAKNKAEENQKQYEDLVQSSHNLIWQCDLEGKFTFLNSAWENTHGYKVEEMLGRPFSDFQRPEIFERDVIEFTKHLEGGFVKGYETTHIIKDGTEIPLVFNALPLVNTIGEIIGTQGTAFDISKLKQTELEIIKAKEIAEESEEKLKIALASMTEAIFISDLEGNFIDFNEAFATFHKFKNKEECGKTLKDYPIFLDVFQLDGAFVPIEMWVVPKALRGESGLNEEYVLKRKDTAKTWIGSYNYAPIRDKEGEIIGSVVTARDITNKKRADELLKENEAQLKFAQQSAGAGLWDLNLKTNKLEWSQELFSLFGLDSEDIEATLETWDKSMHIDDIDSAHEKLNASIEDHTQLNIEYRVIQPNGKMVWINAIGDTSYDEEGNPIRNAGICIDITERKLAEENLQNTFDLSPSIICKANLETGYFIEANQAVTRILGYSVEEFITTPFIELIHPNDQQESSDEKDDQLDGKEVTFFENRYLCKNGYYKWMAWHRTKADENGIVTAIGSDISIRKNAELESIKAKEEALENEEKYRLLHENAGLGIGYYNEDGTIISFNSIAAKDMNGVPEDFAGKSIFDLFPKEHAQFYFDRIQKAINSNEIEVYEDRVELPTQVKWFLSTYTKIVNSENEILGIQIISQNVTPIKQSEVELKSAKEKAEESDRLKSAFLANMSHEIRTPMNGILGFINLLNDPDLSKSEIEKYSAIINRSGDRLLNTINDIIYISKIEAGEIVVLNSETHINKELEELYSFFLPETKTKSISLVLEPAITNKPLTIITDNHKLNGILTNLIKNAIKFTENGQITFGYFLKDDFIEFYVKDTGIGIPQDRINAIFNRFEQADISDTRIFEGSGLGLAISKAYTEMLGGNISVVSEKDKGSTFSFTIPYQTNGKEEIEQTQENTDTKTSNIKKLNLLIVEDDEISTEFLETILKDDFRDILFAENGIDAVEICKHHPEINLVLMDINLPKMNGYQAVKEIRKFNKDIFIIAQTAYALAGDNEKAYEAGCNDYISKPINKTLLLEKIHKLLDT